MRVFCIQHGLRDRHSHFLQESEGIVAACAELGVALRLYAHRAVLPAVAAATGAAPAFRHAPGTVLEQDAVYGVLADYIGLGAAFAADCAALTADGAGAGDIVLLPYAEAWSLHGVGLWLAGLPAEARPRVAAHFVIPERNWWLEDRRQRISGDPAFLRHAAALVAPSGLVLAAVDPRMCAMVAQMAGQPCRPVPMPMRYPPDAALAGLAGRHPPVDICLAGQFRREKGSALVPELLAGLARPGCALAVQVNTGADATALVAALGPAAEAADIHLQVGECGHREWYARLLASRLMLLPYDPEPYAARTSGIFAEAAACGVPMVAPAETWMGDRIAEGAAAGVCFTEFTAASILAAVAEAQGRHPALAEAAASRAAEWRRRQTVAAWMRELLRPGADAAPVRDGLPP